MKIRLAKALQYATTFASNDATKPTLCCAHILDGKVMATDRVACISCDTGLTQQSNQMLPIAKGMRWLDETTGEATDLICKVRPCDESIVGVFKLGDADGLKKIFKTWKNVFKLCAEVAQAYIVLIYADKSGVYMYSADDNLNGVEIKVCGALQVEIREPLIAMYSTKYWEKICTTLADMNPQEVCISFAEHTKLDYTLCINADNCVEIVLAGVRLNLDCPTTRYLELKRSINCAEYGAENGN